LSNSGLPNVQLNFGNGIKDFDNFMNRARVKVNEPPVLFNRGPSAAARFVFFSLLSLAATIADYRFNYLPDIRQAISTALYPVEQAIASPLNLLNNFGHYFTSQEELIKENTALQIKLAEQSAKAQRAEAIDMEYSHLRNLVNVPDRLNTNGVVAEIVKFGRNPFNLKIIVNRGSNDGVRTGLPVIDENGVVGQVTAVTPFSAEITLLTDKGQAVPVMVVRNGLRAVVFGTGQEGKLSIPFLPINADIKKADKLVTSGIDGTYPPGLVIATVTEVEHSATLAFSRIIATPEAGVENHRYLMVLTAHPRDNYPKTDLPTPGSVESKELNKDQKQKTRAHQ
jgi:rod shape-determining protein MreC